VKQDDKGKNEGAGEDPPTSSDDRVTEKEKEKKPDAVKGEWHRLAGRAMSASATEVGYALVTGDVLRYLTIVKGVTTLATAKPAGKALAMLSSSWATVSVQEEEVPEATRLTVQGASVV